MSPKTNHLSGEKCSGGKNSKVRLTGKVAASAIGENLQMYLVGKFKHPRFFKNIKHLPCQYKKQKKAG